MTREEKEDLFRECRMREEVAKSEVDVLAAKRRAEFEAQAMRIYFEDECYWRGAD